MPPAQIRLGTASPATQATTAATLAQLAQIARRAASNRVDILLLPEAYIGGYPRGTNFGCVIGNRSAEGREEYLQYWHDAVDLGDVVGEGAAGAGMAWIRRELGSGDAGDGTREELERIARETNVFIVVGCIEKAGGSLYCSVVYVCPRMGIIGKRRKVMPTATERLVWAQGSPATLRAVSTTIRGVRVNLAAAICWESYMPLLRQALYAQNVNLYLAPTADGRDAWLALMRTAAIEGRCFVVSSNMCVRGPGCRAGMGTVKKQGVNGHTRTGSTGSRDDESTALGHAKSARRSSCVTEDGFEIALPSPQTATRTSPTRGGRRRRMSVFDEDGNEIVLCCEEVTAEQQRGGEEDYAQTIPSGTTASTDAAGSKDAKENGTRTSSTRGGRRRRMSVFDDNGNEIVLCCEEVVAEQRDGGEEDDVETTPTGTTASTKIAAERNGTWTMPKAAAARKVESSDGPSGEFLSRGGSCIVSPFGDVLAGPQWEDDDGIVYADVDFEDCIRGRLDLDTGGSYSRNDSFKFSVDSLDLSPLPY